MKKLLALVLSIVLVLAMSVSVAAVDANTTGNELDEKVGTNSTTAAVDVVITGSGDLTAVYSVIVTWQSLNFEFAFSSADEWNPENHTYTSGGGGWTNSSSTITVTNHSNVTVRAKASFAGNAPSLSRNDVTATISNPSFTINSAVGTEYESAPSGTFTCSVTGVPSVTEGFNIGTITISIEPVT